MTIRVGDLVLAVAAETDEQGNPAYVAFKASPPQKDQLAVLAQTGDGKLAAVAVHPMERKDAIGLTARTEDGKEAAVVTSRFSFIAMSWIDESSPYQDSLSTYNADKAYYQSQTAYAPKFQAGCYAPGAGAIAYCKHKNGTFPPGMVTKSIDRPPAPGALIADFQTLMARFAAAVPEELTTPAFLILAVDNSGSMSTSTIQPAYDNLKAHIAENYPEITIREYSYGNENWLQLFGDAIDAEI